MASQARVYPLNQPENWTPKVVKYMIELPETVEKVAVAYVGIQAHDDNEKTSAARDRAAQEIQRWLRDDTDGDAPVLFEKLEVVFGFDVPGSLIWICYWITAEQAKRSLERLDLEKISSQAGEGRDSVGLLRESYIADVPNFETNYAGTDYRPGISALPGIKHFKHDLTGYWGAARDRIPASAYDKFERADGDDTPPPNFEKSTKGAHLSGSNPDTIVHIRSGQFWGNCSPEEAEAYETKLEPALRNGLDYLGKNPQESGDFGLRFLRNLPKDSNKSDGSPLPETCGAGFFRNLTDLERWAKSHPSHHKIYNGAMQHAREFAADYNFRTWHEVSVLKPGEASFDYVNCTPRTGMIPFQKMKTVALKS